MDDCIIYLYGGQEAVEAVRGAAAGRKTTKLLLFVFLLLAFSLWGKIIFFIFLFFFFRCLPSKLQTDNKQTNSRTEGQEVFFLVGWFFSKASFNILHTHTHTQTWHQPSSCLVFFLSFFCITLSFFASAAPSCLWGEGCQPSTRRKTKFNTVVVNWNAGARWQIKQWLLFFFFGQKEEEKTGGNYFKHVKFAESDVEGLRR